MPVSRKRGWGRGLSRDKCPIRDVPAGGQWESQRQGAKQGLGEKLGDRAEAETEAHGLPDWGPSAEAAMPAEPGLHLGPKQRFPKARCCVPSGM